MRGRLQGQEYILSATIPAQEVPLDHPIRRIKEIADRELARLSPVLDEVFSAAGRASIPPEALLKSLLLIALYSVRGEHQFCERLRYDLLFRFFLDIGAEDDTFDHSTFSEGRDRLIEHAVTEQFFQGMATHLWRPSRRLKRLT